MPSFRIRRLSSSDIVTCLMVYTTSTFALDAIVITNSSDQCLQPVVCRDERNGSFSSIMLSTNNPFAVGKSVSSIESSIVLVSSFTSCRLNYFQSQHYDAKANDMCSVSCSKVFEGHVYLQSAYEITSSTRQFLFDTLSNEGRNWVSVKDGIRALLNGDELSLQILFTSSYEEIRFMADETESYTSKLLLCTMDDGRFNLNNTLERIYSTLEQRDINFILVCSPSCIIQLLYQVYRYETANGRMSNKWVVIPTKGSVEDIVKTKTQIPETDIVVLDFLPCEEEYPVITWKSLRGLVTSADSEGSVQIYTRLTDYIAKFQTTTQVIIPAIANIYKIFPSENEMHVKQIGRISRDGDVSTTEDLFPGVKYGFNNRTLKVGTLEWPPFVYRSEENGSFKYSGICMDLLKELSQNLNFSFDIVEPEDQEWGQEIDGRWTGLIGDLAHRRVDLVVAPIAVDVRRESVMDFTVPYFYMESGIILKKPDPTPTKWMTLFAPFRFEVHICILFSLIFSTAVLFAVEEVHPVNTWTDIRMSARRTRYGDILWYHFGALMANGGAYLPNTQSGRSILCCWWLFTVISAAVYSGNLIAFLTDWRDKRPFTSLAEMIEQETYTWGIAGGTLYVNLFKDSNRSDYQTIWRGMQREPYMTDPNMTRQKLRVFEGNYAHLSDETVMDFWKAENCDVQWIRDQFHLLNYAVGLPNNSIYTSIFSDQVLRINEIGLLRVWYKRWTAYTNVMCETIISAKRVDLTALQSAFYAAGVGVLVALTVLTAEIFNIKFNQKKDNNFTSTAKDCEGESIQ